MQQTAHCTDAVETLCTFGEHAYFRVLFGNESLELFLAHFLLCAFVSQNNKMYYWPPQRAD